MYLYLLSIITDFTQVFVYIIHMFIHIIHMFSYSHVYLFEII